MSNSLETNVCIVGGGPGGAMLAMLLARAGVDVVLVEKSASNKRHFRGESISPDSVALLEELNIMPYIEKHGYLQTKQMHVYENNKRLLQVNFDRFDYSKKFTIDIPQSVLISALLAEALKHKNFRYMPGFGCESLISENGMIKGIHATGADTKIKICSSLVVAADGRYGKLRKFANLPAIIKPTSRDILWFLVTKPNDWGDVAKISMVKDSHIIALPTYPNFLRLGLNIPHGQFKQIRQQNISYLHNMVEKIEPTLASNVKSEIKSWSDTTLLDIFTLQAPCWALDGLVLIGDAAHTLTPILGQGVNQAIKDAVMLSPIIEKQIQKNKELTIPKDIFNDFIKKRKKEVNFVHKFQLRQEKMLSKSSFLQTALRRFSYRIINHSHKFQDKLWGRLLYQYQQGNK